MFKTQYLITLLLFSFNFGEAQSSMPSNFIPEGYVESETYFGDLNNDKIDDCVLVIKETNTSAIVTNRFGNKVDRNRRGIIVLFKYKNGYQLASQNSSCFYSENEDGGNYYPPELWLEIKNGTLQVHYGHGRYGFWYYTFRFQNSGFELIGYDAVSSRGPITLREISINFLTKQKLIKQNTNEDLEGQAESFEETWHTIEIEKLIKLSDINDFEELDLSKY